MEKRFLPVLFMTVLHRYYRALKSSVVSIFFFALLDMSKLENFIEGSIETLFGILTVSFACYLWYLIFAIPYYWLFQQ